MSKRGKHKELKVPKDMELLTNQRHYFTEYLMHLSSKTTCDSFQRVDEPLNCIE